MHPLVFIFANTRMFLLRVVWINAWLSSNKPIVPLVVRGDRSLSPVVSQSSESKVIGEINLTRENKNRAVINRLFLRYIVSFDPIRAHSLPLPSSICWGVFHCTGDMFPACLTEWLSGLTILRWERRREDKLVRDRGKIRLKIGFVRHTLSHSS